MEKYDDYGVPRDVFSKFKWYYFYFPDLAVILGALFGIMIANGYFPKSQFFNMVIFDIATIILAIFLILRTNGDKRNYHIVILYLQKKAKRYHRHYRSMNSTKGINTDANYTN